MHTGTRRSHSEMIDFSDEDDLSNVNVKSLVSCAIKRIARKTNRKLIIIIEMLFNFYEF